MKIFDYPIPRVLCGAKTRTGGSCNQPAMKNGKCRLHGGKSLSGAEHGRYITGYYTKGAIASRKSLSALLRKIKDHIASPLNNWGPVGQFSIMGIARPDVIPAMEV